MLAELTRRGAVDVPTADRVRAELSGRGGALDTILLELDVVDEANLLQVMSECHGIPASDPADLEELDLELAERVPHDVSAALSMCPIRLHAYGVLVWLAAPLSSSQLEELRCLTGLEVHQRVAPAHHLAAARAKLYGVAADERLEALRLALGRRRSALDAGATMSAIEDAGSLSEATYAAAAFISQRLEVGCFLVAAEDGLRVLGARGPCAPDGSWLAIPSGDCEFGPALRFGGYFLGEVLDVEANRRFFASLRRGVARWVFVAPLPNPGGPSVVFFGENGQGPISTRCAAELSLVLARLAQRGGDWESVTVDEEEPLPGRSLGTGPDTDLSRRDEPPVSDSPPALAVEAPAPRNERALEVAPEASTEPVAPTTPTRAGPPVSDEELEVLGRLREAATLAGMGLTPFVDGLLVPSSARPAEVPAPSAALAGDVKDLFERLATDIPAQLARGMEAAFRDLAPRIGRRPSAPAPKPPSASAAASVELVVTQAGPREVPSYRSRRAKTKRVKL